MWTRLLRGRMRTSTVLLTLIFLVTLMTYLLVRPMSASAAAKPGDSRATSRPATTSAASPWRDDRVVDASGSCPVCRPVLSAILVFRRKRVPDGWADAGVRHRLGRMPARTDLLKAVVQRDQQVGE